MDRDKARDFFDEGPKAPKAWVLSSFCGSILKEDIEEGERYAVAQEFANEEEAPVFLWGPNDDCPEEILPESGWSL